MIYQFASKQTANHYVLLTKCLRYSCCHRTRISEKWHWYNMIQFSESQLERLNQVLIYHCSKNILGDKFQVHSTSWMLLIDRAVWNASVASCSPSQRRTALIRWLSGYRYINSSLKIALLNSSYWKSSLTNSKPENYRSNQLSSIVLRVTVMLIRLPIKVIHRVTYPRSAEL